MINGQKSKQSEKLAKHPHLHSARMIRGLKIGLKIYRAEQLKIVIDRRLVALVKKRHEIVYQQGREYGTNGDCKRVVSHEELFIMAAKGKVEINYPEPGATKRKKGVKVKKPNEVIVRARLPEEEELTPEEVTKVKNAVYIHEFDDRELFPALCKYAGKAGVVGKRFVVEYANCGRKKCSAALNAGLTSVSGQILFDRYSSIEGFEDALKEVESYQVADMKSKAHTTREYAITTIKKVIDRCMVVEPVMTFDFGIKEMVQVVDEEGQGVFKFDQAGALKGIKLLGEFVPSIMNEVPTESGDSMESMKRLEEMTPQEVQGEIEKFLTMGRKKQKKR